MPTVVRFALPQARDLFISGVGLFSDGILDVLASDIDAVSQARYLTAPYGAIEIGTLDSTTPPPVLPPYPGPLSPDPYPQYITPEELTSALADYVPGGGGGGGDGLTEAEVDARIQVHVEDTTPHSAYDEMTSLTVLFEAGLV